MKTQRSVDPLNTEFAVTLTLNAECDQPHIRCRIDHPNNGGSHYHNFYKHTDWQTRVREWVKQYGQLGAVLHMEDRDNHEDNADPKHIKRITIEQSHLV